MHILILFLDGIGLGDDDVTTNPFTAAHLPTLNALANGHRWLRTTGLQQTVHASFIPTDACLGVTGRPQSATGQATILTGRNVAQAVGEHFGPRPNDAVRRSIDQGNIFSNLVARNKRAALLEAYPTSWHQRVASGKLLHSSYQYAVHAAGLPVFGPDELQKGEALAGDWTGEGWRTHLGYADTPIYTPTAAGRKLVELSRQYDFAFFAHWMTDLVGHRGTMTEAVALLERFDQVMTGILDIWTPDEGLIIITSDHGNMEQIGDRKHTENDIPTVVIGAGHAEFARDFRSLTDHAGRIERLLSE
jgi:2,3-bisphosphoglycerate-independent phosphoglycerate mutase